MFGLKKKVKINKSNKKVYDTAVVLGTRPEIIKLAPIVKNLNCLVLFTNQHYDSDMGVDFFKELGYKCVVINKSDDILRFLDKNINDTIEKVVVQGDTRSAFYGAIVGKAKNKKVFHVEAGLRTGDFNSPYPEEFYRVEISKLADTHFAPTIKNKENLLRMGIEDKNIIVCGNPIVQSMREFTNHMMCKDINEVLVTVHRNENRKYIKNIVMFIVRLARMNEYIQFNIILHPNKILSNELSNMKVPNNFNLLKPLKYEEMLEKINDSICVLSDSGGIQEECCELGTYCFILRDTTERPEAIDSGFAELLNPKELDDIAHIKVSQKMSSIPDKFIKPNPYFDLHCIEKIVERV